MGHTTRLALSGCWRRVLPSPGLVQEGVELLEHLWVWPALTLLHGVHELYHAFVHGRRHAVALTSFNHGTVDNVYLGLCPTLQVLEHRGLGSAHLAHDHLERFVRALAVLGAAYHQCF